uniref:Uncharacterized protein n=1 Tax=Myotis myotis TaxID=51298 RepID=A0A7J7XZR3_MYOMY|nr:hypothetical protein mMyoMyo1_011367 [Myotis myotis]
MPPPLFFPLTHTHPTPTPPRPSPHCCLCPWACIYVCKFPCNKANSQALPQPSELEPWGWGPDISTWFGWTVMPEKYYNKESDNRGQLVGSYPMERYFSALLDFCPIGYGTYVARPSSFVKRSHKSEFLCDIP